MPWHGYTPWQRAPEALPSSLETLERTSSMLVRMEQAKRRVWSHGDRTAAIRYGRAGSACAHAAPLCSASALIACIAARWHRAAATAPLLALDAAMLLRYPGVLYDAAPLLRYPGVLLTLLILSIVWVPDCGAAGGAVRLAGDAAALVE